MSSLPQHASDLHAPLLNDVSVEVAEPFKDCVDISELVARPFNLFINYLEKQAVTKLGSFAVYGPQMLDILRGKTMLTFGASTPVLDWERQWRATLEKRSRKVQGWGDDVTVEAYVCNIKNAASADQRGLIQPLVMQYQAGACALEAFGLPAVQAVINFKWDTFVKRAMYVQLAIFMVWLCSYTAFLILSQDEQITLTLRQLVATPSGFAEVVLEFVALAAMMPFCWMEARTIATYGLGWFSSWNVLDALAYINQVALTVIHLTARDHVDDTWYSCLQATQIVVLYLKLQYFTRVFHPEQPSFMETISGVLADLRWFLAFYLLLIWATALGFYTLFAQEQEQFPDFSSIWKSMVATFNALFGGLDFETFFESNSPVLLSLIYVTFQFLMVMVLSNMIMGFIVNAVSKVGENEGLKLLLNKAQLIDELESTLPPWIEDLFPRDWYPAYVHVLKIDPKSMDRVRLDPNWPLLPLVPGGADDDEEGGEEEKAPEATAEGSGQPNGGVVPASPDALAHRLEKLLAQQAEVSTAIQELEAQLKPSS